MTPIVLLRCCWLGFFLVCAVCVIVADETTSVNRNSSSSSRQTPHLHHHRVKANRKRCRYSEGEIDELNSRNLKRQQLLKQRSNTDTDTNGVGYYATKERGSEELNSGTSVKHQPKTRDQLQTRFGDSNYQQSYSIEYHQRHYNTNNHQAAASATTNNDKEIVFVDVGDKVNLTCHIRAREIDWHFKDKNMTTTILSYGLQLQVIAPASQQQQQQPQLQATPLFSSNYDDFGSSPDYDGGQLFMMPTQRERFVKYELSSDRHSTHVLTLHVQGAQDEGAYQCVDAKSDVPVKKTILVYLKNDSRALTSGYNNTDKFASFMLFYTLTFLITVFNS